MDERPGHFQDGFNGSRNIQTIPFHPTSVLHPVAMSPNGLSQSDAQRRVYTGSSVSLLPTSNGQSSQNYAKVNQFNPYHQIGS